MPSGTGGWDTLRPADGSLRLGDATRSCTVAAKVRTGGNQKDFVYVDVRAEGVGHAIVVLDNKLRPVVHSLAKTRQASWEQCQRLLKEKGL
jgi:hypothetical protein